MPRVVSPFAFLGRHKFHCWDEWGIFVMILLQNILINPLPPLPSCSHLNGQIVLLLSQLHTKSLISDFGTSPYTPLHALPYL